MSELPPECVELARAAVETVREGFYRTPAHPGPYGAAPDLLAALVARAMRRALEDAADACRDIGACYSPASANPWAIVECVLRERAARYAVTPP